MKIDCLCGTAIPDQTDYISYKAHTIPDQDIFDLYDELDTHLKQTMMLWASESDTAIVEQTLRSVQQQMRSTVRQYTKTLYQCPRCGRLYVENETGSFHVFAPESHTTQASILRSVLGDQWRRPLRGWWSSRLKEGKLWDIGDAGDFEQFDDWNDLQTRYYEIFHHLRDKAILRDAILKKDEHIIHKWPSE
jgi:hypothetical protein